MGLLNRDWRVLFDLRQKQMRSFSGALDSRHRRLFPRLSRFSFFSLLCALCVFAVPSSALAQGCAMCYTSAAATSPAAQRSLDLGILVLLIPTLLMFVGILVFTIRRASATN